MKTRVLHYMLLLGLGGLMMMVSCEESTPDRSFYEDEIVTITDYLKNHKETYSYFWQILEVAELRIPLTAYNPFGDRFTLFLPSDGAFEAFIAKMPEYTSFEDLLADVAYVRLLGRYHLVNKAFNTNEFPYGALPDTTASGDFLTVGFSSELDTTFYKINNVATIEAGNIEVANGFIHVINQVLEPNAYDSFEWLQKTEGFSIISGLLELTGLKDTMGIYRKTQAGEIIKNRYTVLAEHDSIYLRNGISSLDDLIDRYSSPGLSYDDPDNELYQLAAYHLLEGSYFLDEFIGSSNYNTYANFPVQINAGLEIRINTGADTFRIDVIEGDTSYINYISLYYQESNQLSKNGAIHMISEIMELFKPSRSQRTFQFYEEPQIFKVRNIYSIHEFVDVENFEIIKWTGPESLYFVKAAGDRATNEDYILIEDEFTIEYTIPKVIPGKYTVSLRTHAYSQNNASIQVYIDGQKLGGNLDLTAGGTSSNPYKIFNLGELEFSVYEEHLVFIQALIPGQFIWDYISFTPV